MGVRGRAIRLGNGPPASKKKRGVKQHREDRARPRGRRQQRTRMGETRGLPRVPWGADRSRRCHGARTSEGARPRQERQLKPPKDPHRRAGLQQQTAGDPTRPRASPPSEGSDGNASSRVNDRGAVAANGFGGGGSSEMTLPHLRFLTFHNSNFSRGQIASSEGVHDPTWWWVQVTNLQGLTTQWLDSTLRTQKEIN